MNSDRKINEAYIKVIKGKKIDEERKKMKKYDMMKKTKINKERKMKKKNESINHIMKMMNKVKDSVKNGKDADAFNFALDAENEIKFLMSIII